MSTMEYTVQQLAKLSGVSKRTLHYYDEIDLLKPKAIRSNGYRIYGLEEVTRLQQILFFKSFGLSLIEIQTIMAQDKVTIYQTLQSQQMKLIQQKISLEQQIQALAKTLQEYQGEITMTDQEKFNYFKQQKLAENEEKYDQEIREKYGEEAVQKSNQKWLDLTPEQFETMQQAEEKLIQALDNLLSHPQELPNDTAQMAFEAHKTWLTTVAPYYNATYHRNLAEMYQADERFRAYYDEKTIAPSTDLLAEIIKFYTEN